MAINGLMSLFYLFIQNLTVLEDIVSIVQLAQVIKMYKKKKNSGKYFTS